MIDIIIPAYNAHSTIYRTLSSIAMQITKLKLNIIIVDDNSDENYDYLKEFFPSLNIKIIRNSENKGPGYSRNIGLDNCKGEYILFIDADDMLVNAVSLNNLYNSIGKNDICSGYSLFQYQDHSTEVVDYHDRCLHGKLYKRKFIVDNNIRFFELYRNEDAIFHKSCLVAGARLNISRELVYFYTCSDNSLTHKSDSEKEYLSLETLINGSLMMENVIKNPSYKELAVTYYENLVFIYANYLLNYNRNYKDKIIKSINKLINVYDKYDKYLNDNDKIKIYSNFINRLNVIPVISFNDFIKYCKNYK